MNRFPPEPEASDDLRSAPRKGVNDHAEKKPMPIQSAKSLRILTKMGHFYRDPIKID